VKQVRLSGKNAPNQLGFVLAIFVHRQNGESPLVRVSRFGSFSV
jgi:hypothetical protein